MRRKDMNSDEFDQLVRLGVYIFVAGIVFLTMGLIILRYGRRVKSAQDSIQQVQDDAVGESSQSIT
jgi:hypothetical protein